MLPSKIHKLQNSEKGKHPKLFFSLILRAVKFFLVEEEMTTDDQAGTLAQAL